jgi:D-alanyl-D-alanine carboxypeptidase
LIGRQLAGLMLMVAVSGAGVASFGDSAAAPTPQVRREAIAAALRGVSPPPSPAASFASTATPSASELASSPTAEPSATAGSSAAPSGPPEQSPLPVTNRAPLPKCGMGETPALLSGYDDWSLTLVDTNFTVGQPYVPPDLQDVGGGGFYRGRMVRAVAVPDLLAMAAAARNASAPLAILSSYRDYSTQVWTFGHWVNTLGPAAAFQSSARPGHSEHQLGLAIDFRSYGGPDPWSTRNWAKDTAAGIWMAANAWRYGFVMSYPYGKTAVTCYGFEPWHYRYVGRTEADAIYHSGLTVREWLWLHQPDQRGSNARPEPDPMMEAR